MSSISNNSRVRCKQGNIVIALGITVILVIFCAIFLVQYQLNIIIDNVRRDLFYSCNSGVLSFDLEDLGYRKYTIDEYKMKETLQYILNKNYTEERGSITNIDVIALNANLNKDKVELDVKIKVRFRSVVNLFGENSHTFTMKENVKIALMKY